MLFSMARMRAWILLGTVLTLAAGCGPLRRFLYEGVARNSWQQPDRVVESLELAPGSLVADIGAGGGYFTWRLADAVGETGKVFAVDVDPEMTSYLEQESEENGYRNVQPVLAEFDDPLIPEGGVDLIFTCNTYHHLEAREEYFRRAAKYLRPGGRVAVIEFKRHGLMQRLFPHFTAPEVIHAEMEVAGYRRVESLDYLERQSFQIFELVGE
jgi:ubiquinone/menaquinone biosynthesis C-methylase UbiE